MSKVKDYIASGKLWKNSNGNWCKRCPNCDAIVESKGGTPELMHGMSSSITKQQVCHSCIKIGKPSWSSLNRDIMSKRHTGKNHPMYGRHHTEEMKNAQRKRYSGIKLSDEHTNNMSISAKKAWQNPESREKYYSALLRTKWLNVRCDVGQSELLKKWNNLGFKFEINYQIKCDNNLYYVDGYDMINNICMEYDSEYHNKPNQQKKDKIRQDKIISYLSPKKFWRYNKKTGVFTDVISNQTITTNHTSRYVKERQKNAGFIDE
jgi:hypothetical protein